MALVIELPPKMEEQWIAAAEKQGVSISHYVMAKVMGIQLSRKGSGSYEDIKAFVDTLPRYEEDDLLETILQERAERRKLAAQKGEHPFLALRETAEMLADAPEVLYFSLSENAHDRVWNLVWREKRGTLTREEKHELEQYEFLEHLMRMVKARAKGKAQTTSQVASE
jgi:hypothetical protein